MQIKAGKQQLKIQPGSCSWVTSSRTIFQNKSTRKTFKQQPQHVMGKCEHQSDNQLCHLQVLLCRVAHF